MRTVAEKKDAKPERSMKSAPVGPSAAAVYGFNGDDVENQAAYAAWGGRSAWRSRGLAQALTIPEAPASADEDADEDLDSGVDGVETHMSVFTFLKIVSGSHHNFHRGFVGRQSSVTEVLSIRYRVCMFLKSSRVSNVGRAHTGRIAVKYGAHKKKGTVI